jgi:spermidine/putrescine transport system permease protein
VSRVADPLAPPGAKARAGDARARRSSSGFGFLLCLPGLAWLATFFLVPFYVVIAISFGGVDPIFRSPLPAWNPMDWRFDRFTFVFSRILGEDGFFGPPMLRTLVYMAIAIAVSLAIAYPVAYFAARHAGGRRGLVLTLLLAPFWISYMMRMLAWVNLLQDDGLVNRAISLGGLLPFGVSWLDGRDYTVVLGLVYGYTPYMILAMFASLDRISPSLIESARDLGCGRFDTFRRVVLPMSVPGVAAGLMLAGLPMIGDYFTNDLLSNSPGTAMLGNLINGAVTTPGQASTGAALICITLLLLIVPMTLYVRSTARGQDVRS